MASWLVVVCCLCDAKSALAVCPSDLVIERRFYQAQDFYTTRSFNSVRDILEPLLVEDCVKDRGLLRLSRLFIGVAFLEIDEPAFAEKHLLDMLMSEPDMEISSSVAPRYAIEFIEKIRGTHRDELDRIRRLQGTTEKLVVENFWFITEVQRNQYWINFLPFGAGSFQNGDQGWGIFFASAQSVMLSMSVGGWVAVETLRGSSYTFTAEEAAAARDAQVVQLVGAGGFAAFYLWSVLDGILKYRSEIRISLPPTDRYPEDLLKDTTQQSGVEWTLTPYIGAEGGGVGVLLRY